MIKLHHGDCLDIMPSIPDGSVDLILADPPYGTTACKWDSIIPLEPMWARLKRIIKPNGAIVMTASQPFTTTLIASNIKQFKYCWYWDKGRGTGFLNAKIMPMKSIEDIVIFGEGKIHYTPQMRKNHPKVRATGTKSHTKIYGDSSKTVNYHSDGDRYPLTLISIKKDKINRDGTNKQQTQKPIALMEYMIRTYTNEGETVLDFTMGSGTTGVACQNTNRSFIGIEKDAEYFKIAQDRINASEPVKIAM